jgi:dephospho-CoA kinase
MKIIGLTGGIGSGKSTVARFLAELGATVIDTDKIGHEILEYDNQARSQALACFDRQVLTPEGRIDRQKLGRIVFKDPEALFCLNRILHSKIYEAVKAWVERYQQQGVGVVVVEAPLLIEAGWNPLVDEVWVTTAPRAVVIKRLKLGMGLSRAEALARIRSQLPAKVRSKHANVIINTNVGLDELKELVRKLWQRLII